jgi:hypothetical protein
VPFGAAWASRLETVPGAAAGSTPRSASPTSRPDAQTHNLPLAQPAVSDAVLDDLHASVCSQTGLLDKYLISVMEPARVAIGQQCFDRTRVVGRRAGRCEHRPGSHRVRVHPSASAAGCPDAPGLLVPGCWRDGQRRVTGAGDERKTGSRTQSAV